MLLLRITRGSLGRARRRAHSCTTRKYPIIYMRYPISDSETWHPDIKSGGMIIREASSEPRGEINNAWWERVKKDEYILYICIKPCDSDCKFVSTNWQLFPFFLKANKKAAIDSYTAIIALQSHSYKTRAVADVQRKRSRLSRGPRIQNQNKSINQSIKFTNQNPNYSD